MNTTDKPSVFSRLKGIGSSIRAGVTAVTNSSVVRQGSRHLGNAAVAVAKGAVPFLGTAITVGKIAANPTGFVMEKVTGPALKAALVVGGVAGTYFLAKAVHNRYLNRTANATVTPDVIAKSIEADRKEVAIGMLIFVTAQLFLTIAILRFS